MTKNKPGKGEGNEIRVARSCGIISENTEKSLDFLLEQGKAFTLF